jgi:hypothetical protein
MVYASPEGMNSMNWLRYYYLLLSHLLEGRAA